MWTIYALADSRAPEVTRYVGKTSRALSVRLRDHLKEAGLPRSMHLHKARWIRTVIVAGASVVISALEHVESNECANDRERFHIAALRGSFKLTNGTDGGDGQSKGYQPTAETRRRLSVACVGRALSPEHVEKIAASHRGRKRSPETCARISAAKRGKPARPRSDEYRARLSAALKGKRTPEHSAVVAELNRNRVYTPELRARISEAQRRRYARARGEAVAA